MQWGKPFVLKGSVSLIVNPANTPSVYDIEDGMCHDQATRFSIEFIKQQPGIPELIAERYLPPLPDLQALQQLPEGSLGHCYLLDRIAGYRLGAKAKPFLAQRGNWIGQSP